MLHRPRLFSDVSSCAGISSVWMEAQSKQRVFTGVVTQLQDNYGMVDQEVHFQTSDVIGRIPQLGEKVLVKAVWDPSVSVSWTAQRVQSLNSQPFKSPPPLLPTMTPSQKPGILGSKPQPLLKSPKIPPLIPSMQQNPPKPGLLQTPSHLQAPWGAQFDAWGNRKRHGEGMGGRRGTLVSSDAARAGPAGPTARLSRFFRATRVNSSVTRSDTLCRLPVPICTHLEDGGSWGGDAVHQKRRRWRGSFEEGEKKSSPTPPQNCPLFSRFPRDSSACDSLEVQRRYPHLPLPENFLHLQLSWTESFPPDQPLNLSGPCPFHLGPAQSPPETSAAASPGSAYSAKVMLLSVPAAEELYQRCCGLTQDQQEPQGGAVHPTTLIKFLLALKGSELQLLGGRWCPLEDGSNPAKDPLVLIRTAVRCVKEQTGLDLSHCSHWHKMAEVRYLCGGEVETAVFYLPDVWRTVPTEEEWAELRASAKDEQEDGALPLPEDPSLVVYPCPGTSLSSLALSYLLEPRNSQSQDAFEVALSAELLKSGRRAARPRALKGKRGSETPGGRGRRTGRGEAGGREGARGTPKKRRRTTSTEKRGTGIRRRIKDGESETASEEGKMQAVASDNSDGTSARESDRPAGWSPVLPRRVLLSWVFFDRQLVGSLRGQDLQDILLSLGLHLTPMQYRRLAGRWEDPEHRDPDSTLQGNSALIPSNAPKGGGSSRRSGGGGSVDVVTHKGSVLNIPNLLRSLERGDSQRQGLEQRIAALQARLAEAESETESLQSKYQELSAVREGQEDLRERLERAERLNSTYEKSLKENAGHMIAVIEKMQKLVDKTTSLAESRVDGAERA
ncbi:hypothetical protein ANANG_G00259310 [Anguilla anguilla]|uniref:DBC1/CARP1 catalytically inactive NUDIX hydrolase domain-containing protein n=1 Tax=Anguilla anguilla TaxID=7936 RepID=A0A9D3RL58_ANGAN|nr:hypothetical protein ANANG_G00259310 [Anguilla anguilla]